MDVDNAFLGHSVRKHNYQTQLAENAAAIIGGGALQVFVNNSIFKQSRRINNLEVSANLAEALAARRFQFTSEGEGGIR
jgi:hypothetical protein